MFSRKLFLRLLLIVSVTIPCGLNAHKQKSPQSPRLTVVFVIDQFAYHYLPKIESYLQGGMKTLLQEGVVYRNAYMPHANPTTGPGHTTISTGAYPKDHGVVANAFLDENGKRRDFEATPNTAYAVLAPGGTTYDYGVSPETIMVDNISDQLVKASTPQAKNAVFAISLKSTSAVALAGKLGKAIWYDKEGYQFTSSKAYFNALPTWLNEFNRSHPVPPKIESLMWKPYFAADSPAYNFHWIKNYVFAGRPFTLINQPLAKLRGIDDENISSLFEKTPFVTEYTLELALHCIESQLSSNKSDKLLVWVCISALDLLGHLYGPDSMETTDFLYQTDAQLKKFMDALAKKIDQKETLYALTADHGVEPIIEILQQQGMVNIGRISTDKLMKKMNTQIEKTFNIPNIVIDYLNPAFYLNREIVADLPEQKKTLILEALKKIIVEQPGITRVWTEEELRHEQFAQDDPDMWYKLQLYKDRSGDLICKCNPYTAITNYPTGTQHQSNYEYDTHIPLIVYQKDMHQKKTVCETVYLTQLAATLAKIYGITKPSAAVKTVLPEF